jgi:hypothetical protein
MPTGKFGIAKDSNEPWSRCEFRGDYWKDQAFPFRKPLRYGDYAPLGYEDEMFLEWKERDDFVGSCTVGKRKQSGDSHRDNFRQMWERALPVGEKYLLINGTTFHDLCTGQYFSRMEPEAVVGTLASWQRRYGFRILFSRDASEGELYIYWLCRAFLNAKEREKKDEEKCV